MALSQLNVQLGLVTRDFDRQLGKVQRSLNRFAGQLTSIGSNLTTSITLPIAAVGGVALKTAAEFEQLRTSFNILLGSVDEGSKLFKDLQDFAAATPFQLADIAAAGKQLLAFGFSADETKGALKFLGDIAAGTGSNLSDLGVILGQSRAIGAAYTEDLRQLANRGIPIFDVLKDRLNLTGDELRKFVSDGNVSFEILQDALRSTTEEGGLFAGGLQAQSKTLTGLFSTLKDNVSLALADLGQSISTAFNLGEVVPRLSEQVQGAVKAFQNLDEGTKRTIVRVAAFAAAIGPAIFALGKFISIGGTILQTSRLIVTSFAGMTATIVRLTVAFNALNLAQKASIIGLVVGAVVLLSGAFSKLNDQLSFGAGITARVANASREASKEILAEQIASGQLFEQLKDTNKSQTDRAEILDQLKQKFPDYLGDLQIETITLGQIEAAQNRVNDAIVRSVAARQKATAQDQIAADIAAKLVRIRELEEGATPGARESLRINTGDVLRAGSPRQALINAFNEDVVKLRGELTKLDKVFDDVFGVKGRAGGGRATPNIASENAAAIAAAKAAAEAAAKAAAGGGKGKATADEIKAAAKAAKEALAVLRSAEIERLEREGFIKPEAFDITKQSIQSLRPELSQLNQDLAKLPATIGPIGDSLIVTGQKFGAFQQQFGESFTAFQGRIEEIRGTFEGISQSIGLSFEQTKGIFVDFLSIGTNLFSSLTDAFANAIVNGQNFGQAIVKIFKDLLIQLIKVVIAAAAFAAILSAFGLTGGLNFGSTFGQIIGGGFKIPKGAKGGIVPPGYPGDTYPALLTSGEAVIPQGRLDQLLSGGGGYLAEARISGNDLLILLRRAENTQNRVF